MDEVEELEPTRTNPLAAPAAAATSPVSALDDPEGLDDVTLAALLRQTARLRAIELQLAAVYDLRGHTEAMRGMPKVHGLPGVRGVSAPDAASDCA